MKKQVLAVCLMIFMTFFGCAVEEDPFLLLRGSYAAEVEGMLHEVAFAAKIERACSEDGALLTVTFYAPDALRDTKLIQEKEGTVSLCYDRVRVVTDQGMWHDLLCLFDAEGHVTDIFLNEEGRSVIVGEDFSIELLSGGIPYHVQRGNVQARVIAFEKR